MTGDHIGLATFIPVFVSAQDVHPKFQERPCTVGHTGVKKNAVLAKTFGESALSNRTVEISRVKGFTSHQVFFINPDKSPSFRP